MTEVYLDDGSPSVAGSGSRMRAERARVRVPVIGVPLMPGMSLFEIALAYEVLGASLPDLDGPLYDVRFCAEAPIIELGPLAVVVRHGFAELSDVDTILVPSLPHADLGVPDALIAQLHKARARGARMVGLSTAAGTRSGMDLYLELVRRDYGHAVAGALDRWVSARHRGDVKPDVAPSSPMVPAAPTPPAPLGPVIAWALEHLHEPITPEDLARASHRSTSTLGRQFRRHLGVAPARWLTEQRVRRAQELLEHTVHPISQIAPMVGFESVSTLRANFGRIVGMSPRAYRNSFP